MILAMEERKKDNNSIQVSDTAAAAINRIQSQYIVKIGKKDMVERLLVWFSQQTDVVQAAILGILPASQRVDIARLELERLANEPGGVSIDRKTAKQLGAVGGATTVRSPLDPPKSLGRTHLDGFVCGGAWVNGIRTAGAIWP